MRKLIHIKGAKGRKDRYTLLSGVALAALKEYYLESHPKRWLFHGQKEERHIT